MTGHDLSPGALDACQICASHGLELVLDLGHHPPCDSLLTAEQLRRPEPTYPLRLVRCLACQLVQIDYVVEPDVLFFPEYPYRSGITETLSRNLQAGAGTMVDTYRLPPGSLVVDLGSNDGTFLQGFQARGMRVLGIEPTNIARIAIEQGVPTIQRFFSHQLAQDIRREHGPASLVTAANMFAHVARLGDLVRGVHELLAPRGLFVVEAHYLVDLLETCQYDSIYHEHLKYYSLGSLLRLFGYYDFTVVDAERIPNYGGSLRVYAVKGTGHSPAPRLAQLLEAEERAGLRAPETYRRFRDRAMASKLDLAGLLVRLAREGRPAPGIGSPGRSSTLLNYSSVDPLLMPYVAEQDTSLKLGLHVPGRHIPIVDEKRLLVENPDHAVILSWHYGTAIMRKLRDRGLRSRFILPLPEVRVAES